MSTSDPIPDDERPISPEDDPLAADPEAPADAPDEGPVPDPDRVEPGLPDPLADPLESLQEENAGTSLDQPSESLS